AEARQRVAVDLRGEFESVVERLHRFALIEPVGCPMRADEAVSEILTAWLHITNDCNLRCRYCYLNKTRETMDERTGRAALEAVVGTAVRHGFAALKLKYAGGEASLEPELVLALHAYARELTSRHGLALHATLLTNGVAMPPGLAEALLACDIRVMVSFDGVGDSHDAQRLTASGGPSFRSVERTIARLTRIGIAPHLSITLTKLNAAGVADAVRFALERDLTFSLNLFRDAASVAASDDLRCADQPLVSALLEAFAVIEEHLPPWSVLGSVLDRGQLIQPRRHSCGVGRDYVVIDHRGRVAPCHMEIERSLGDVFQDDPLDLVRADNAIARRNPPVEGKEGCCDCTWRYWCSGGCPVATFQTTGRYDLPSPNCDVYRAIYPAVLRLEGLRLLKYSDYPALGS
ncbi:MAG: SPASM domain-containing protein, partial [Micromonosporaceae bacterium]|nr:SPASM domain-containing protein [Micromonosporaceae bacterium]